MIVIRKIVLVFLLFHSGFAFSGPGYEVTGLSVSPLDAPQVVAALDEWMNSQAGKKYKGRLFLQESIADGANPATHSLTSLYPSMAESEAYGKMVTSDPDAVEDWMKLLSAVVPIATPTSTAIGAHVMSWGDLSDKDSVWIVHSFTTQDAAAVVAAMNAWMGSDVAKRFPGQMHLGAVVAAGVGSPSHTVSIGYESMAEMEAWNESVQGSSAQLQLLHTFQGIAEYHGASISQDVKVWGKSIKSILK